MKAVVLAIKPKYANLILKGEKRYEFRKCLMKRDIKKVYLYSSSPTQKIVGYFIVDKIICGSPKNLWKITKKTSGIKRADFFNYFKYKKKANAIKIKNAVNLGLKEPKSLFSNFVVPQNFIYVN